MSKPILIAMMGLPRSGKSTIVERLKNKHDAPVVRRDAIRLAVHGLRYASPAEPMIKAMSLYMIRSLFLAGHEVVICDETNYSRAARLAIQDSQWETLYYPVLTPPEVCKERAVATNQADLIPVIDEMYARYEPLTPTDKLYLDYYEGV